MTSERICSDVSQHVIRTYMQNWSHYVSLTSEGTEKDCLALVELLDMTRLSWKVAVTESQ
uniref:Uncharacterized protein n=1 Tax=Panagrolaimus sp. JU765 TaxID=591449 RepID=A0AC34QU56_9BILA